MIRWTAAFAILMLVFALFIPSEQATTVMTTLFWTAAFLFAASLLVSVFGWRFPSACGRGSGHCSRF
jgi:hypothetical protein